MGFLLRKNFIILLMCIELMLAGAILVLVSYGRSKLSFEGEIFSLFVIAVAAAEVGVGLAIAFHLRRKKNSLNIEELRRLGE